MDKALQYLLRFTQLKKKYLAVYLKGCRDPLMFAVADTEATYNKIKKSMIDRKTDVLEKICIEERGKKVSIPLSYVIAVAIQDVTVES